MSGVVVQLESHQREERAFPIAFVESRPAPSVAVLRVDYAKHPELQKNAKGLIIFIGWLGSQRRHIEKHLEPLVAAAPFADLVVVSAATLSSLPTAGKFLAKEWHDAIVGQNRPTDFPIAVQVCSNGGVAVFRNCVESLSAAELETLVSSRLNGILYYCCPIKFSLWEYLGFMRAYGYPRFLLRKPLFLLLWLVECLSALFFLYLRLTSTSPRKQSEDFLIKISKLAKREVFFLYSQKDKLVDYTYVEAVADRVKREITDVNPTCLVHREHINSEHVQLLRFNPELYTKFIQGFLERSKLLG